MHYLNDKVVLITGGTGSFGQAFVKTVLKKYKPKKLIVFSRDEYKQYIMGRDIKDSRLRFFMGDVRDAERLHRAFRGVQVIVHAAALKQVPALEYNPFEAIKTNVIGAENIINVAIDNKVERVLALSSDKAVNPINLYGASKLCADKLFVSGNFYSAYKKTYFSVVRYGNVINSRGSVIPIFKEQRKTGILTITDTRMTRFWVTLEEGVKFVLKCLDIMQGGEIFVPKLPSMKILDVTKAIAPRCKHKIVGMRPGEKLHEVLIPEDESHNTFENKDMFVVLTPFLSEENIYCRRAQKALIKKHNLRLVKDGFRFASNTNAVWIKPEELKKLI